MSCWETSAPGSGRTLRRVAALTIGVATLLWSSSVVDASAPLTPAEKAAEEIQDARDRADAAAQALFDTEAEIDRIEIKIGETEDKLAGIEAEVDAARSGLEQQAVRSFVGAGGSTMPLLIDITATNDVLTAEVYSSVATENVYTDLDDYDALLDEVDETREDLDEQQADADAATASFATLIEQAEAEVILLGQIEEQRLEDEAVRKALEAQQVARAAQERQEQQAQAEREAAAAAASARSATPASTGQSSAPAQVSLRWSIPSGCRCHFPGWHASRGDGVGACRIQIQRPRWQDVASLWWQRHSVLLRTPQQLRGWEPPRQQG
jgi:peptidoglycan hydrolase CwlO-like protein